MFPGEGLRLQRLGPGVLVPAGHDVDADDALQGLHLPEGGAAFAGKRQRAERLVHRGLETLGGQVGGGFFEECGYVGSGIAGGFSRSGAGKERQGEDE